MFEWTRPPGDVSNTLRVCTTCLAHWAAIHMHADSFTRTTHTHKHTQCHVSWFVHKPMTFHSSYSRHFCSSSSVSSPFLSLLLLFTCLFCPFVKRSHYFSPPQARDDDGLGGKLHQHSFTQDTPRLVFKTNSDVLVRTITIYHQIEFKLDGYCTNMFWCCLCFKVCNFQAISSWRVKGLFHIWPLLQN